MGRRKTSQRDDAGMLNVTVIKPNAISNKKKNFEN